MPEIEFGFSESEMEAFTDGDCWLLAEALHERHGYDLVVFGDFPEDAETMYWTHIAGVLPDSRMFDIRGIGESVSGGWVGNVPTSDTRLCLALIRLNHEDGTRQMYPRYYPNKYADLVREKVLELA